MHSPLTLTVPTYLPGQGTEYKVPHWENSYSVSLDAHRSLLGIVSLLLNTTMPNSRCTPPLLQHMGLNT